MNIKRHCVVSHGLALFHRFNTTANVFLLAALLGFSQLPLDAAGTIAAEPVLSSITPTLTNSLGRLGELSPHGVVTSRADSGPGTLRQVLATAVAGDTITFRVRGTIFLSSPLLAERDVQIVGPGRDRLKIDGQSATFIFQVNSNVTASISDITLLNGFNPVFSLDGSGGAIRNLGNLTLTRCVVTHSSSEFAIGGGIFNGGDLTVRYCSISNNSAPFGGGIGDVSEGSLVVDSSTISSNVAVVIDGSAGGGIFKTAGLGLFTNVTVSGNSALDGNGGGIFTSAQAFLENCTVVSNVASTVRFQTQFGEGGGICVIGPGAAAELRNTIVAGNSAARIIGTVTLTNGPDIFGPVVSHGWNLIQNPQDAVITGDLTGNIIGEDPNLGPLRKNGGVTLTHALLPGSPAIDAASPVDFPRTDQRGVLRPQDGDGDRVARADIGSFERRLRERAK